MRKGIHLQPGPGSPYPLSPLSTVSQWNGKLGVNFFHSPEYGSHSSSSSGCSPLRRQGSGIWGPQRKRRFQSDSGPDPNFKPIPILHFGICRWWWQQLSLGAVRCPRSITCRSWERSNTGESRGPGSLAPSLPHPPPRPGLRGRAERSSTKVQYKLYDTDQL